MIAKDEFGEKGIEERGLFHYTMDFWSESLNEAVTEKEGKEEEADDDASFLADMCCFLTKERYVICARFIGSTARFINHSCEPNADAERWLDSQGRLRIAIVATEDIRCDEEVTIDYAWNNKAMTCHCQSTRCRGHL